jgi:excinuclease ABC subunit B
MMDETRRRRKMQIEFNQKHGITPTTIIKEVREGIEAIKKAREIVEQAAGIAGKENIDVRQAISDLENEMEEAARRLDFERAIRLRDEIRELQRIAGLETAGQTGRGPVIPSPKRPKKRSLK